MPKPTAPCDLAEAVDVRDAIVDRLKGALRVKVAQVDKLRLALLQIHEQVRQAGTPRARYLAQAILNDLTEDDALDALVDNTKNDVASLVDHSHKLTQTKDHLAVEAKMNELRVKELKAKVKEYSELLKSVEGIRLDSIPEEPNAGSPCGCCCGGLLPWPLRRKPPTPPRDLTECLL